WRSGLCLGQRCFETAAAAAGTLPATYRTESMNAYSASLTSASLVPPQQSSQAEYLPQGREVEIFASAAHNRLPVLIKGPTGCGKTRFVQHMAEKLKRKLFTVA